MITEYPLLHNGGTTRFVKGVVTKGQTELRATAPAVVWWSGVELELEHRSSRGTTAISISYRSEWDDKRPRERISCKTCGLSEAMLDMVVVLNLPLNPSQSSSCTTEALESPIPQLLHVRHPLELSHVHTLHEINRRLDRALSEGM